MKPTALQLLAHVLRGPDTSDAATLAAWVASETVERLGSTYVVPPGPVAGRRAQVIRYVARAAAGELGHDGGYGSLKHLLWWLRDHAGGLYESAGRAVLEAALASNWSLVNAAEHLRAHPLVGGFATQALQSERAIDLARHLTWEDMPRGRVAWNRTTLNLSKIAFRGGARWYVAVSTAGGCLMGARGQVIAGFAAAAAADDWTQPYPNLVMLRRPGTLADEQRIRQYLDNADVLHLIRAAEASADAEHEARVVAALGALGIPHEPPADSDTGAAR